MFTNTLSYLYLPKAQYTNDSGVYPLTFSNFIFSETNWPVALKTRKETTKGRGTKSWSHDKDGGHTHIW